jgi:hypothetical protein
MRPAHEWYIHLLYKMTSNNRTYDFLQTFSLSFECRRARVAPANREWFLNEFAAADEHPRKRRERNRDRRFF